MWKVAAPLVLSAVLVPGPLLSAAPEDKAEKQVKEVVEQFMKACIAEDLDAVMKLVDVPWYSKGKVTKNLGEVKEMFKEVFDDKDAAGTTFEIVQVLIYPKARDLLKEKSRKPLDEVLGKNDWVVILKLTIPNKPQNDDKLGILVRVREGKTKVVGLGD